MLSTVLGIYNSVRLEHSPKAEEPMAVTVAGMEMLSNWAQPYSQPSPIFDSVGGNVILFNLQLEKAGDMIVVTDAGMS